MDFGCIGVCNLNEDMLACHAKTDCIVSKGGMIKGDRIRSFNSYWQLARAGSGATRAVYRTLVPWVGFLVDIIEECFT